MVDKHSLALMGIIGSSADVLGTLYLAYDLLGGEHGPLRTLTRGVTYGLLAGVGFGIALGPLFGLAGGIGHGISLAWEFSRASRRGAVAGLWFEACMSAIRGLGYAIGAGFLFGWSFGIAFGTLSTLGQVAAYRAGIRPTLDFKPGTRPRISRRQSLAAVNRTVGYGAAGYISALWAHERAKAMTAGLEAGLAIGIVTVLSIMCTPFIEWIAETLPPRRMGLAGICLILAGFGLQSLQYWVALLDLDVR